MAPRDSDFEHEAAGVSDSLGEIELLPLGRKIAVKPGTPLQDVLFTEGVEFACGGRGRCRKCKIRVLEGALPVTEEDRQLLSASELESGWRLACRGQAQRHLKIELAQWEAAILADDTTFEFTPEEGLGVAIDLGTTTVVAQLLDRRTGQVLAVRTALNPQARHGGDIMSRIEFALNDGGQRILEQLIRDQLGDMIVELLESRPGESRRLNEIVLVGNTVMHHLFCGIDVSPLAYHPFEPEYYGLQVVSADDLDWSFPGNPRVRFLPCLGGFVGSDILAGILATRLHESEDLAGLIDLGTNGEMVVGHRGRLLCASTAAGPAFEGARISMGMRAATGAVSEVHLESGQLRCRVLGNVAPRGICGSGLVDAVAAGLEMGWIKSSGKVVNGNTVSIAPPVHLTQCDIRELQLAKGAIAAGLRLLTQQLGARLEDVSRIYLAGAFGNYINRTSARRIGLINFPIEKVHPAGNTALLGAKLALFNLHRNEGDYSPVLKKIEHLSLNVDPQFQETYVQEMRFPE